MKQWLRKYLGITDAEKRVLALEIANIERSIDIVIDRESKQSAGRYVDELKKDEAFLDSIIERIERKRD